MDQRNKIKVMHVALALDIGGLERLITQMSLAMDRERFITEVVTLNREGCFAETLREQGITVTLLQKNQQRADYWYPVRLARFLRQRKVHVLHMHTGVFIFGALASRLAFTPATVYTEHGRSLVDDPVRNMEDRLAVKLVDRLVPVSTGLKDILIERINAPERKLEIIINGIATDMFCKRPKPSMLLSEYGLTESCHIVGTVARLDAVKDQLTMIQAFERIDPKIGDSRLFLVGDGPERDSLTAYIHEHGLQHRVIITGPRNDVPEFLNLFDVFVLSSLSEGTSVSLLEAMASGVPPVVTRVGGNPAIVENEVDGFVVEPRDPQALSDAITAVLSNSKLQHDFSERGMAKVNRDYSIRRMVESYSKLYLDILHRKNKFTGING